VATTKEQNERLTQVGPGTPMGNLLRRYWQPVGVALELDVDPVRSVRIFGEDLTLYRSSCGEYGLITDRCAHRCMSMAFGIPDDKGLRCAYHGWVYDATGACVEQPFEDRTHPEVNYKNRIMVTAYPVQELGGLLFAYFGPQPAPLLPRWDLLVRDDLDAAIEIHPLPCSWLQCMDNSVDPVHFEFLHAVLGNYTLKRLGRPPGTAEKKHLKIDFDPFRFGIIKRRLVEGEDETSDEWAIGHPLLFPNILAVGEEGNACLQFRVPIDDEHTFHVAYRTKKRQSGAAPLPITVKRSEIFDAQGRLVPDTIPKQDMAGWVGQGVISDRTREHLTASDKGVILYRKMLVDNMERVARGEEPMALIWDRSENEPMVDIRRERVSNVATYEVKYGDYFEEIREYADHRG
jgi:5,5'-dehydrodivanillate O-demethylase